MPGMPADSGGAIIPFSGEPNHVARAPPVRPIRHGVSPPIFRVFVSWSSGNLLQVACLRPPSPEEGGCRGAEEVAGSVVEVNLAANGSAGVEEEIDDAEMRRIEYGSVPAFALLQSRKNALADTAAMQHMHPVSEHAEWWQYVLQYSKTISKLLGNPDCLPAPMIEDPRAVLKVREKPTSLKAAWELLEIFYVDKELHSWLPERLVDCYNLNIVFIFDFASCLYMGPIFPCSFDHMTENGLVEAVAVLVSTMPRMRPDLPTGKLGQCCKTRPDFIKGFEGMHHLAQKCIQLKPSFDNGGLTGLLNGILSENPEVVLAECTKKFGPWMVTHSMELLAADNEYADIMLHEERPNFGGLSIEELHRLVYAQVLSSHSLTWQIAPTYLSSYDLVAQQATRTVDGEATP
uniref:Uncharacterized protein n=1 Tax=Avena sativa TaxID=4498 RepID=A0ACD5W3Y1_AVESA